MKKDGQLTSNTMIKAEATQLELRLEEKKNPLWEPTVITMKTPNKQP
jgi:hypothetical protein